MKLYWQERRAGQRLILADDDETEVEVGAVRQTPRGYDALAKTNTYDPGRAQKGFATIEEAKVFVEEFHPWDIFGGDLDMEVEPELRRTPGDPAASGAPDVPPEADSSPTSPEASTNEPPQVAEGRGQEPVDGPPRAAEETGQNPVEENQPRKRGWKFWRGD